jgi:IS1 family transposase
MNRLSTEQRAAVVAALVEGNSLRGTARMTGVARMTVEKLLRDIGAACAAYHDAHVRALKCQRIQCDEIWSFVGAKERNTTPEKKAQGWGDCWTWTAIDADSRLIVSWLVADRSVASGSVFMQDVAARAANRIQMTTDGLKVYFTAIDSAFGVDIDYAILQKVFAEQGHSGRYSPARFVGAQRAIVTGNPNPRHISTSYVERHNLSMRMHMRRFTRLTNGFSKKVEMHAHMVALHFMHYNFCKIHQTLRITPAMAAGLSDHAWEVSELVGLLDQTTATAKTA